MTDFIVLAVSALVSAGLTWAVRVYALSSGLLDTPNARSSHAQPTVRGGGLAIVTTTLVGTCLVAAQDGLEIGTAAAMCISGAAVATVGYFDDRKGLSALPRIAVHIGAAVLILWVFTSNYSFSTAFPTIHASIAVAVIAVAIVWSINLYNFMDGIDGIAASQGAFVASSSAVCALISQNEAMAVSLLLLAGACLGFLFWNRPPAKIFMGDVGSGFLGFWLAAAALLLHFENAVSIWTSVLLSSLFISDATATLLRRVVRGKRWYEAHRSHAYQHLAKRWKSHGKVTCLLWILNCLIVLPLAGISVLSPDVAPEIAIGAVVLFSVLAWFAHAGLDEEAPI